MDIILPENVFDTRLESRSDSATNLFACLAPENMTDNGIQPALNDSDTNDTNEAVNEPETLASVNAENPGNEDECSQSSTTELVQSGTENEAQISSSVTQNNEFTPTIIDIRGACNDSSEKFDSERDSQADSTADGNVTSNENENDAACIVANDDEADVHTISDQEDSVDSDKTYNKSVEDFNTNVVIKQEPLDEDNDCMLVDSNDIGTCFTSEIEIKEERLNENNDNEVICVETTSQIPLPIPIKIEANFESDKEVTEPEPTSNRETEEEDKEESDDVSTSSKVLSKKSSSKTTTSPSKFHSSAYKCHLCNTVFQEHELLNEHMKLHRNNSLIERYNKAYPKQRTKSKYICRTCGKRLSTGQSLSQHMMIHNNEKPHVCPICKKDFRHLSNFKMHVQKHKEEEELRRKQREKQKHYAKKHPLPLPTSADRSLARSADFGRLVGPLFVKESMLKKSPSTEIAKPTISPKTEYRKSFELKYPKPPVRQENAKEVKNAKPPVRHENAKENLIYYKKTTSSSSTAYDEKYSRARKFNDDIGDDVIPLKTFNNVENIVMNATKFIVKVDNLDANLLKKKIKTPDISIDKSASSIHSSASDRKRRVQLSPSAEGAKRLKLDQIENIIMDSGASTSTATQDDAEINDADDNYDYPSNYYDDDDDENPPAAPTQPAGPSKQETLTDNELFELLNDDRDCKDNTDQTSPAKSTVLVASQPKESVAVVSSPVKSTPPKSSNVIVLKSTPSPAKSTTTIPSPAKSTTTLPPPVKSTTTISSPVKSTTTLPSPAKSPKSLPSPLPTPVVAEPAPVAKAPETPTKTNTPPLVDIATPPSVKSVDLTNDTPPPKKPEPRVIHLDDSDADEDEEEVPAADKCDMYDDAFRNVALRRLNLIHKKASQNGGKVENKYLLGPLFWRKVLRKAKRNQLTKEPVMSLDEAKVAYKRINALKFGKQDSRRTNDPAKLQTRAELKLQYILSRIKAMNDIGNLNLAGPLFWKRTLKLAGVHDPNDLKRLLNDDPLTIDDVEFVTTKVAEPVSDESNDKSTTTSMSTSAMNGDVMIIDDEDSNTNDNSVSMSLNDNSTQVMAKNTPQEIPSSLLLPSLLSQGVKSAVTFTTNDFLESIVVRNNTSQRLANGSHQSIVDGILNDDLLKPKTTLQSPAPSTTPILTRPAQFSTMQVLKTTADSTKEPARRPTTKAESLLYDSLTKPKVVTPPRTNPTFDVAAQTKPTSSLLTTVPQHRPATSSYMPIKHNTTTTPGGSTNRSLLPSSTSWTNNTTRKIPSRQPILTRDTKPGPVSRLAPAPPVAPTPPALPDLDNHIVPLISSSTPTAAPALAPATVAVVAAADTASHHQIEADSTTALEAGGNIILNVDSADFQLIADAKNENGQETNYVLVSDGSGGVQLIKENDFRLLEEARASSNASHYIVNVPNEENFANFDLIGNAAGTNGEQLAYIQLDNENFTALQFIQDGSALEDPITAAAAAAADKQKIIAAAAAADKSVAIGGTNYVIAADPATDLNHIGKELSDFLHIDYGTLLKNDHQHEQT